MAAACTDSRVPVAYRQIATVDADEQACVGSFDDWGQDYEQLTNGPFSGLVEDLELLPLTVVREASNCILLQTGNLMPDFFAFGIPVNSNGESYFCGSNLAAGSMVTIHSGAQFEMRSSRDFEIIAAVFNPGILCRFIADPEINAMKLADDLRALPYVFDTPVAAEFVRFLGGLLETARNTPEALQSWAIQAQVANELIELVSACMAQKEQNACRAVRCGRDRLVRRVRQYLDRSWDEPINVAVICADLEVTRRTLQNAIQEVLGVSPLAYLKAIRLNGVRRALKKRERDTETIGDIVAQWGFWHLSQFAQDYCRLFGERPSDTRKRSPTH